MAPSKSVLLVLLCAGMFFSGFSARAEEVLAGSVYNPSQEADNIQRARRRIYPGGRDEGELTVQAQMTAPTRKIAPQAPAEPQAAEEEAF